MESLFAARAARWQTHRGFSLVAARQEVLVWRFAHAGLHLVPSRLRPQVEFKSPKGVTLSELIDYEPGTLLRWMEVENSVRDFRMVGAGATKPRFTTSLADSPRGTVATLR